MRRFYVFWWRCREKPRRAAKAATRQAGAAAFAGENGAAWLARTHFAARWSTSNAAQLVTGIAEDLLASTPYVGRGARALACVDIAVLVDVHVNRGADGVP